MSFWKFSRFLAALATVVIILAGCGDSDDAAETEPSGAAEASTDTTAAAPSSSPTSSATTIDERTDEERAIDQLDLMLVQLRTIDLVATADCVVDRLRAENIEIVGRGAPEIVAALGCDPTISAQLFSAESFDLTTEQRSCVVDALGTATAAVPLDEAEAFFSTPVPPDEVLEGVADDCEVSVEELVAGFG